MPALSPERFEGISLHLIKASVTYCEKSETIRSSKFLRVRLKGGLCLILQSAGIEKPPEKRLLRTKQVFLHNLTTAKCINSAAAPVELCTF